MDYDAKQLEELVCKSAFWKNLDAARLNILAWVDDHFTHRFVQAVIDFPGKRETDCCGEYYDLIVKIQGETPHFETGSSHAQHETIQLISDYILLKAEKSKELMVAIKKDKIEALRKELAALEVK